MIKKILLSLLIGIALSGNVMAAAFLEGFEDFPIMNGLEQVEDSGISFGNAESRFVEAHLTSTKIKFKSVEKFYIETLPQMGWVYQGKRDKTLIFYRESESIEISQEKTKPLMVRITLKGKI